MSISRLARNKLVLLALLLAVTAASYWRTSSLPFVHYDDDDYIINNAHVQSGINQASLVWAITTRYDANWHPLTWLSHAVDCSLFGLNPEGHHLTNLIVHLVNVALLFWVLHIMTAAVLRSAFVAGLFALHPLNVESVAWVAERKNLLSTFFFLLTIGTYTWYARRP